MPMTAEKVARRWASSTAVYGLVSISLVIVAWESDGGDRWDLPYLILGYIVLLLLTHTYADFAASGVNSSWRRAFWHELPVTVGGVPALVVSFIAALANANDQTAAALAL